jgi:hypothetical protein
MLRFGYIILISFFISCSSKPHFEAAKNGIDASREFIDACLKGDYEKANFYLLATDSNKILLDKIKNAYQLNTKSKKAQFADASIIVLDINYVDEKTMIFNYKNSLDLFARKLKAVMQPNGNWLIDLQYTQSGNL